MSAPPKLRRGLLYLLPLALLMTAPGARIAASDLLERLSLFCFDLYQKAAPREPGDAPIRIVDIDDKSLNKLGQWPWPRSVVAQLVDRLREAGAAVVAFDIDFAEPDRTSPKSLVPLLAQNGVGAMEAEKLLAAAPDPDRRLAEAIGGLPVVTGFILTDHSDTRPPAPKAGFAFVGDDPLGHVDKFPAAVANLPGLEEAAAGNGFPQPVGRLGSCGPSGTARIAVWRQSPIPRSPPRPCGSPSEHAAMSAVRREPSNEKSFGENTGLTAIRIGELAISTDPAGRVWLHYAVPRRDRFVSAADILAENFDPARFAGHIVLVGTTAGGYYQ